MDKQYNLSNLEAAFKQYLLAVNGKTRINTNNKDTHERTLIKGLNPVSIKNYLSDLRHFLGWMVKECKVQSAKFKVEEIQNIVPDTIKNYVQYQKQGETPIKTINRRLSTLRKFGGFCISQGWMKENVFKKISNVATSTERLIGNEIATPAFRERRDRNDILDQYQQYLVKQNLDRQNINNLIADTKEFYQLTQNL